MNDEYDHQEVERILGIVHDLPESEHADAIDELCYGNAKLINELRSLIAQTPIPITILSPLLLNTEAVLNTKPELVPNMPHIPGLKLLRILGQGANGTVYLAQQENPSRLVALKILKSSSGDRSASERMLAEAHILARLEHPFIARLYEMGILETNVYSHPYFVMEYIDGTPLNDVKMLRSLSVSQTTDLILSLCEAIGYAHTNGIVHRDIKPSNVLVIQDSSTDLLTPKVIDFGISKVINDDPLPIDIQTLPMEMLGTLRYMCPERIDGRSNGDSITSDVYSIGVIACEIFEHMGTLPRLSTSLQAVFDRMTSPKPKSRFQSISEVTEAIESTRQPTVPWWHKPRALSSTILLLALAFVLLASMISQRSPGADKTEPSEGHAQNTIQTADDGKEKDLFTDNFPVNPMRGNAFLNIDNPNPRRDIYGFNQKDNPESAIFNAFYNAVLCTINGNPAEAMRMIAEADKMKAAHIEIISRSFHLRTLLMKAFCISESGDMGRGNELYLEAREMINPTESLNEWTASKWNEIAKGIQNNGDYDLSGRMYTILLEHRSLPSMSWQLRATVQQNYAGYLWITGQYESAENLFRTIIRYEGDAQNEFEKLFFATIYSSLGVTLRAQKKYDEADSSFLNALDISSRERRRDDPVILNILRNRSVNMLHNKQYSEAAAIAAGLYGRWSINSDGHQVLAAESGFILSSAELGLNKISSAITRLENEIKRLDGYETPTSQRIRAISMNALGEALCRSGETSQGILMLIESELVIDQEYRTDHPWAETARERAARFIPVLNRQPEPSTQAAP